MLCRYGGQDGVRVALGGVSVSTQLTNQQGCCNLTCCYCYPVNLSRVKQNINTLPLDASVRICEKYYGRINTSIFFNMK